MVRAAPILCARVLTLTNRTCTGTFKANYPRQSFDTVIRQRNAPDAEMFVDFLRQAFILDPDQRAKVSDLLAHPWLNP